MLAAIRAGARLKKASDRVLSQSPSVGTPGDLQSRLQSHLASRRAHVESDSDSDGFEDDDDANEEAEAAKKRQASVADRAAASFVPRTPQQLNLESRLDAQATALAQPLSERPPALSTRKWAAGAGSAHAGNENVHTVSTPEQHGWGSGPAVGDDVVQPHAPMRQTPPLAPLSHSPPLSLSAFASDQSDDATSDDSLVMVSPPGSSSSDDGVEQSIRLRYDTLTDIEFLFQMISDRGMDAAFILASGVIEALRSTQKTPVHTRACTEQRVMAHLRRAHRQLWSSAMHDIDIRALEADLEDLASGNVKPGDVMCHHPYNDEQPTTTDHPSAKVAHSQEMGDVWVEHAGVARMNVATASERQQTLHPNTLLLLVSSLVC